MIMIQESVFNNMIIVLSSTHCDLYLVMLCNVYCGFLGIARKNVHKRVSLNYIVLESSLTLKNFYIFKMSPSV